ncbi:MAG: hypothetical protein QXM75_02780 [Candidatus Diapherotrites archaeon]
MKKNGVLSLIGLVLVFIFLGVFAGTVSACNYTYTCTTCPNTLPTKPNVYIMPSNPTTNDDLYCYANSYDPDCDTITYHYRWYRNGVLYYTESTTSNYTYISSINTSYSDTWKCVVKAFDGRNYSEENSAIVKIAGDPCIDFDITTSTSSITMKRNDTQTLSFWVQNKGNYSICVNLRSNTSSSSISSWVARENVCVNANESKLLSITIRTSDTPIGNYSVRIIGESNCYTKQREITVKVEDDSCYYPPCCPYPPCYTPTPTQPCYPYCGQPIELVPIRTSICKNSKGTISVLVKNLTDRELVVRLESSSVGFASSFEQSALVLSPREEKYVNLNVYTQCQSGEQYVTIYGKVDSYTLQRKAIFTVIDCPKPEAKNFSVEVPVACTSVQKMQTTNIGFTIKNLTRYAQTINLQVVSNIVAELDQTTITLEPFESRTLYVRAYARESDKPGKQYITLYAWQDNYKEKKELCVDVQQMHKSLVTLLNNDVKIAQCSYGVFSLNIHNVGDTIQNYKITTNNPTRATIKFSETNVSLYPNQTKEVFITVNVPVDMPTGTYSADIVVENSSVWIRTIYFEVVKAADQAPATTDADKERPIILSYPSSIVIKPGTQRQLSVVLQNPTSKPLNVVIDFVLPGGLYSQPRTVYLAPGATETTLALISADLEIAQDKHYDGLLVVRFDNLEITRAVNIYVEKTMTGPTGAAVGLFTLENPFFVLFLLILAFVVILFILKAFFGGGQKKVEVMLYRR